MTTLVILWMLVVNGTTIETYGSYAACVTAKTVLANPYTLVACVPTIPDDHP